jgi:phospholipid/cholesterol/gamma-HCH transport system ATP-binding protein
MGKKEPLIKIRNICKSFGNKKVLDNLNLDIYKGEILVILGPSGCGKSVLLKHIMGLLQPDEGDIFYKGKSICKLNEIELNEIRKDFGMLFQGAALFDSLTVGENVSFGLREHTNLSKEEIDKIVEEKLAMVGLPGISHMNPAELSGGMKKRVGLARAIAMNPKVILYDEPTTGLDPVMVTVIDQLTKRVNSSPDITTILVTHDMVSAFRIADRLAMHFNGRIIETGTIEEFKNSKNEVVQQFITGAADGPITREHHSIKIEKKGELS